MKARFHFVMSLAVLAAAARAQGVPAIDQSTSLQVQQQMVQAQQYLLEASKAFHRACVLQQDALRRQGTTPTQRCIPPVEPPPLFQTAPSERAPQ